VVSLLQHRVVVLGRLSPYPLFFFQAEDGIRDRNVTGVQTCALPIWTSPRRVSESVSVEYSYSSGTGLVAEVTTDESRPVVSSMVRQMSLVSPRVADMSTNCACGISSSGTCQAHPRAGSAT